MHLGCEAANLMCLIEGVWGSMDVDAPQLLKPGAVLQCCYRLGNNTARARAQPGAEELGSIAKL